MWCVSEFVVKYMYVDAILMTAQLSSAGGV